MRRIPPFTRSFLKGRYQIVVPNTGIRHEESRLLGEAAEKRRLKLSCLLCDTELSFADPECSTCGATTQILLYSNPDGSYTVMPYLLNAQMTDALLEKALELGHMYGCLSCNQQLGREGECSFCQSKTYYVKPHNERDACSLLPELCLIENYIRQVNEVDLRVLGVDLQLETDAQVKDVRELQASDTRLAAVETSAPQSRSRIPSMTEAGEVSRRADIDASVKKPNESIEVPSGTNITKKPARNSHKDVAAQIIKYLCENGGIGTTLKMRAAIDCSPQGFKKGVDKLIEAGRIRRIARGVYELINHLET